ncbi:BZ3500_MvSof-1268-A1-R1_Chr3-2g06253 [Microbotryum saponariae]|uniref:BZ3500_MvSof-1268-A1-R1_Chr3-2g06253 protein n=1 Tax=Microbotryum saponariae TaxID=289078 RepID=A0A2X0LBB3_9BASI|nr:BZ3500_MvSof-1268-A1-R1_Chr3-2g06253 [Microbotryum saponariae]SDA04204.1 BZ3501_MvSof-1269-A2-R1_Chr3-2g05944 [Microbotryum saponariae]
MAPLRQLYTATARSARPLSSSSTLASTSSLLRAFSTSSTAFTSEESAPPKVPIALISEIRSLRPGTPLSLARSALTASALDVPKALEWIVEQTNLKGGAKVEKLSSRSTPQGLVGIVEYHTGLEKSLGKTGGVRVGMVEINCETDFVARTDEFKELVRRVVESMGFFAEAAERGGKVGFREWSWEEVKEVPLIPEFEAQTASTSSAGETISSLITSSVSRLGENITLSRCATLVIDPTGTSSGCCSATTPSTSSASKSPSVYFTSSYLHGSNDATPTFGSAPTLFKSGTLASLLLHRFEPSTTPTVTVTVTNQDLLKLARQLARQVVAMPTSSAQPTAASAAHTLAEGEPSQVLYEQPSLTIVPNAQEGLNFVPGEAKVGEVLELWKGGKGVGFEVVDLLRWTVGEKST